MIRTALAMAAIAAFAATPAHAASNCLANYEDLQKKISGVYDAKVSTETVVAIQRMGLRAFDACNAGDEASFSGFWDKMSQFGEAKDQKAFWEELSQFGEAKK